MNNYVLFTSYFSLSCCVCIFALLHSGGPCHKLLGSNLKEKKKRMGPNIEPCGTQHLIFSYLRRTVVY